jgi:hypothetical protein
MQRLRVMKGDLYFSHTVYILRKGSPLESSINSMIQWVRDAGLFVFWEGLTVRKYMSTPRQISVINSRNEGDMGPTKLLLQHVSVSITGTLMILRQLIKRNLSHVSLFVLYSSVK